MFEKVSIYIFLVLVALTGLMNRLESNENCCLPTFQGKVGYYIFTDKNMRNVYDSGGFEVQLSSSYACWDCLSLYGSIGYQGASGRSTHFHQRTYFWQIPLDIGLRQYFSLTSDKDFYVSAGPRVFYAHQHNHSSYVNKNISKVGLGLFVNAGIDVSCGCSYKVTLFTEYSYQPVHPATSRQGVETRHVNVGGFLFGAGLTF
jgi:hypothetical protein